MNGVCAACGKFGALLGASAFPLRVDAFGYPPVFAACAAIALLGAGVTAVFVEGKVPESDKAEDSAAAASLDVALPAGDALPTTGEARTPVHEQAY